MPIFKAGTKLVFYAHVPKCGGTSVAWYLSERFGPVAFSDNKHVTRPAASAWFKTSPQHIDRASLRRLFPASFFDAHFSIVRHPVARVVSAYHFQLEVEKTISANVGFSDWLDELPDMMAANPFIYDHHVRPMDEIVPKMAEIFHMEHGLDGLVLWLDALTGTNAAPRAIPRINERGGYVRTTTAQVVPSDRDLDRIQTIYAADFERFGYRIGEKAPAAPAPVLPAAYIAERDAALREMTDPVRTFSRKVRARLGL